MREDMYNMPCQFQNIRKGWYEPTWAGGLAW